ncbi:hypothetical protein [Rhizosphaericola mali]|uniref:Uncharacterized protein n=1 Tax=Rhizosphaericola mali TaxID=2545455 RepID=A0A5P2FYV3_9BACT|nr:hypothetical protein [Rhizosphaericola mali]QES88724.1 hypothetical protein E0W69_008695 [Rhizosphaericola mali]
MADIKRRILGFSTGKQIKLYGNSLSIGNDLQIGEGGAPNLLSFQEAVMNKNLSSSKEEESKTEVKKKAMVINSNNFSKEEIFELADYAIGLWMDLKDSIRRNGLDNPKIFKKDS